MFNSQTLPSLVDGITCVKSRSDWSTSNKEEDVCRERAAILNTCKVFKSSSLAENVQHVKQETWCSFFLAPPTYCIDVGRMAE